jgi:hypothetical protein
VWLRLHRQHRAIAEAGNIRVPGDDYDGYIESHIRRLEALRRAGIVERINADHWSIPADYKARAAAYDPAQSRRANLRVLSTYDLDRQITSDGATWLDRELASPNRTPRADIGFGAEVSRALERRKDSLVDQGMAMRTPEGGVRAPRDLLSRLERQEIARAGLETAKSRGLTFKPAEIGNYVSGTLVGTVNLASGKFAMIDDSLGFSLVPWHPVARKAARMPCLRDRHAWRPYRLDLRARPRAQPLKEKALSPPIVNSHGPLLKPPPVARPWQRGLPFLPRSRHSGRRCEAGQMDGERATPPAMPGHAPEGVLAVVCLDNPRDNTRGKALPTSLPSLGPQE